MVLGPLGCLGEGPKGGGGGRMGEVVLLNE